MSEAYLGEIRMFAGNFAPQGWALCNGQNLPISENEALFALIGTTYGGDGQTTFALPDLQGRVAIHPSNNYSQGQKGGTETVALTSNELPVHAHPVNATSSSVPATGSTPSNAVWANSTRKIYSTGTGKTPVAMSDKAVASAGGNQPHDNMMPSTVISFIIALEGIFPTQG